MATRADAPNKTNRVARLFGLSGESWMRHANPASVWTRFSVLPLLMLAVWSRDWIGLWFLIPLALSLVWLFVNPLFFSPPTLDPQLGLQGRAGRADLVRAQALGAAAAVRLDGAGGRPARCRWWASSPSSTG